MRYGGGMTLVRYSSHFDVSPQELFDFHLDVANLARISPPLPHFELLSAPGPTTVGTEQVFRLSLGPFGTTWRARILKLEPGHVLEDVQASGPFRRWRHRHEVKADGRGSELTDVVSFRAIPTPVGEFLEYLLIRPGILAMFVWRHRKTNAILSAASRDPHRF
jgi:ligand-binding SRPBCC domain-containing protein